jgi:hypothetical protein
MIEIGGRPILWHLMKIYSSHGVNDFVICCGYKGYIIKEYFANYFLYMSDVTFDMTTNQMQVHNKKAEPWRVTLVDTGDDTLTGGRLKRVSDYIDKDEAFCFTYGDGVADVNVGEAGASGLGVNVTANVTWNATKAVHWIQFSGASGAVGDGALSWNVMPNTGSVAREAVISVTGGGETRLVTVRQAAGAVRRVGETFALSAAEGVGTVQKVTGLPSGMIFDRLTGQVSGRPTQSGTFLVKVDVLVGNVVEKRVMTNLAGERRQFGRSGKLAVNQQIGDFDEAGFLGEVFNAVSAITQNALIAVDERDRRCG